MPDRRTIAQAALDLIDREGLEALSMRRVAAELRVDPMMLYRSVPNREGMVRDVAGLLLDEIDTSERPGEAWDGTLLRLHLSEREMALRHPHAYPLLVLTPRDEEPVVAWARHLRDLLIRGGLPEQRFFDVWSVDASFTNGFLLLETATLSRKPGRDVSFAATPARVAQEGALAHGLAETVSGEAFVRGLELIYRGLKDVFSDERP